MKLNSIYDRHKDQWDKQLHSVNALKQALKALNSKIEEATRKKAVLIARKRRADAMRSIQDTMSGLNDQSAFEAFERMEGKIVQAEAEAEAAGELNEEFQGDILKEKFAELEQGAGADAGLEALKRKMGILPAQEQASIAARVEPASAEELEMAELDAALEELKAREGGQ